MRKGVQTLLGCRVYHANEHTYAGSPITRGHGGRATTVETIPKNSKAGATEYVYYSCSGHTAPGHPCDRVNEKALDAQVLQLFERIRIQDDKQGPRVVSRSAQGTHYYIRSDIQAGNDGSP